jgi:t-SNARE complex subunit (syntaxin)
MLDGSEANVNVSTSFSDEFSKRERAKIRRRIIVVGIVRLVITALIVTVLAGVGFLAWLKIILSIDLHALK